MTAPDEETLREALHRIHHVATCTRSDCGERHSYMEIPANPKRDADLLLSAAIDELVQLRAERAPVPEEALARMKAGAAQLEKDQAELVALRERVKVLEGLKPELPPGPLELDPDAPTVRGLPRYGLRWNGPQQPLAVPMPDGYWTPWHLAAPKREGLGEAITKLTEIRDWLHRAQAYDVPSPERVRKLIDRCDEAANLIDSAMPPERPE